MKNAIVSFSAAGCVAGFLVLISGCSTPHSQESMASPMKGHQEQDSQGKNTVSTKGEAGMMGPGDMKSGGMMDQESMKSGGMMNNGMMAKKMDRGQMIDMMNKCVAKNNDKKACEHEMMTSCQEKMDMQECAKMNNDINK